AAHRHDVLADFEQERQRQRQDAAQPPVDEHRRTLVAAYDELARGDAQLALTLARRGNRRALLRRLRIGEIATQKIARVRRPPLRRRQPPELIKALRIRAALIFLLERRARRVLRAPLGRSRRRRELERQHRQKEQRRPQPHVPTRTVSLARTLTV